MAAPIDRSNCGSITTVDGLSIIWMMESIHCMAGAAYVRWYGGTGVQMH